MREQGKGKEAKENGYVLITLIILHTLLLDDYQIKTIFENKNSLNQNSLFK
jgi:hypothetical protein